MTSYKPDWSSSRVLRGANIRAAAMPLGGIGTGTIALAGDGSLRQWQIVNQANHKACLPHSFFAIRTHAGWRDQPVFRVLQTNRLYDSPACPTPPPTSSDHVVPPTHRRLLDILPGVQSTEFLGEYPFANVRYLDDQLPVDVSLTAWNPFVPLNSDDSGIPSVVFTFTITNRSSDVQHVSLAGSLQNAVGWEGVADIADTYCTEYGTNANHIARSSTRTTLRMSSHHPQRSPGSGAMSLSVDATDAIGIAQYRDLDTTWRTFAETGSFGPGEDGPSAPGQTWSGALSSSCELGPGESRDVSYVVSWRFPNRYVNYANWGGPEAEPKSLFWIGNRYATVHKSIADVEATMWDRHAELLAATTAAHDAFFASDLPDALIDTVTSQLSIVRTPTCFVSEAGDFYGFEGCNGFSTLHHAPGFGGSCPLNCTHVWNYEMAAAALWPNLERTMRSTEWNLQQHESGYLPHRVVLPTYAPRLWDRAIGGPDNPALDGLLGAILKTHREFQHCGDVDWLRQHWPHVLRALDYVVAHHDPERRGVIEGEQPNTYDISIYGLNTFIGTLYLAVLRSVSAMATILGDDEQVDTWIRMAESGGTLLDERLWNGSFYIQEVDLDAHPEQNYATGCHIDHLLGQWWADVLGLGPLLDPDHLQTAVKSIFTNNHRDDMANGPQPERQFAVSGDAGVVICTWPNGGRPEIPTRYSDEVWTGLEYELAALLMTHGSPADGITTLEGTRGRYDGAKQNPWNDIECGDHYVRATSSFSLLSAWTGIRADRHAETMTIGAGEDRPWTIAPFAAGGAFGVVQRDGKGVTIRVLHGDMVVRHIELDGSRHDVGETVRIGAGTEYSITSTALT